MQIEETQNGYRKRERESRVDFQFKFAATTAAVIVACESMRAKINLCCGKSDKVSRYLLDQNSECAGRTKIYSHQITTEIDNRH
jgi:hypothetical protein